MNTFASPLQIVIDTPEQLQPMPILLQLFKLLAWEELSSNKAHLAIPQLGSSKFNYWLLSVSQNQDCVAQTCFRVATVDVWHLLSRYWHSITWVWKRGRGLEVSGWNHIWNWGWTDRPLALFQNRQYPSWEMFGNQECCCGWQGMFIDKALILYPLVVQSASINRHFLYPPPQPSQLCQSARQCS